MCPRPFRLPCLALLGVVLLALSAVPASAGHVVPARVEGETRIHTAANIARLTFQSAATALLARADAFPDALAAGGLAGVADAPILLTHNDELPQPTRQALSDLGVQRVLLLGGPAAIGPGVEDELDDQYTVERIAGETRFGTSAQIARRISAQSDLGATPGGKRSVFVASGLSFPDALAASAPAAGGVNPFPILLTTPDRLPAETVQALDDLPVEQAIIVGGQAAVSLEVEQELERRGLNVVRLAGPTRMHTAVAVADFFVDILNGDVDQVLLARGDAFPDALAAAPHAGTLRAPILLTPNPDELSEPPAAFLERRCPNVRAVRALGGTAAISIPVLDNAVAAANACPHGTDQTFIIGPQEPREAAPGSQVQFDVIGRFDEQPFTGPVDLTLFPCESVDPTADPIEFTDADDDGHADLIATTDTNAARIATVEGTAVDARFVNEVSPGEDERLSFVVSSPERDCAVPVVFTDADDDDELDVGEQGRPTEEFGVAQVRFVEQ